MDSNSFSILSLMVVTCLAFLIPIVLQKFKINFIPVVVAEILVGIVIGKSGFDIVDINNSWLQLLSTLGLIFLMFLSGLEIDFSSFRQKKKQNSKVKNGGNPLIISSVVFLGMMGVGLLLSLALKAFGLNDDVFFMLIILTTVSLGVVVPVLKDSKLLDTKLGQTVLLIAVISDFITMILFAYYLAIKDGSSGILVWILFLVVLVVVLYLIINLVKKKSSNEFFEKIRKGTSQIGTRGVFALILFFVAISETLGVENILGAFLAGVVVSLIKPDKELVHQLDSFGYGFLIPIFFVMVGVEFDLFALFEDTTVLLLIPIVIIFLFITRFVPTLLLKKWFGWKNAISSGILLTSTMSLAIVAASVSFQFGIISESLSSAIIFVAIVTCFISPIIYNKLSPKVKEDKKRMVIIGANRSALKASLSFKETGYDVVVYSSKQVKVSSGVEVDNGFPIVELEELSLEGLKELNFLDDCDELVISTSKDELNVEIAEFAEDYDLDKIIIRIEDPVKNKELKEKGYHVYSNVFAGEILLKAMVYSPSFVSFLYSSEDMIKEFKLMSDKYDNLPLRKLPFLGDVLILVVNRDGQSIVPNGDTILLKGDKLILSGSQESLKNVRNFF